MYLLYSFALISHCCYSEITSNLLKRLSTRNWSVAVEICSFRHKSIRELTRRPEAQSVLQLIPKMFNGIEVKALCRSLEFFHTNLGKPSLHGPCAQGHCHAGRCFDKVPKFHTKTSYTDVCLQQLREDPHIRIVSCSYNFGHTVYMCFRSRN